LGQSSARRVGFALAQPSVSHGVGKLVLVADVIRQAVGSDENVYPQVNGENSVPVSHHWRCDVAVETERDRPRVRLLLDEIASSIGCDVDFEPAICERVVAQHSPAVIRLDNECGSVGPQHALLPVYENPQVVRRVEVVIQQSVHAGSRALLSAGGHEVRYSRLVLASQKLAFVEPCVEPALSDQLSMPCAAI